MIVRQSLLLCWLILATKVYGQSNSGTRNENWIQDIEYIRTELPTHHLNSFHQVSQDAFNSACYDLEKQVKNLKDYEVIVGIRKILSLIGEGHTNLFGWENNFHRYPFRFFRFYDGYYVTRATEENKNLLGAKLLKIGNTVIDSAFNKVTTILPKGEGEMYLWNYAPVYLSFSEVVASLKLSNSIEKTNFTFQDSVGKVFNILLSSIKADSNINMPRSVKTLPLYIKNSNQDLWFEYLKEKKTIYFGFNHYPSYSDFVKFSGGLLTFIDTNAVDKLIIDLRNNSGGDESKFQPFLEGIIRNDSINRKGHLFVITGRVTYSAGLINAAQLKRKTNAILVGEPTGSNPNQYNESAGDQQLVLPNSKLRVDYALRYYHLLDTNVNSIVPDIYIKLTSKEYIDGKDPALDKILSY